MPGRSPAGSGISKLVERQMRNWELARSQRPAVATPPEHAPVAEFIAVSRLVGARAAPIADTLAERLGWPVFDREVLSSMAGDDAIREVLYRGLDQRDTNWIEETLRWIIEGKHIPGDYFRRLSETVLALARQGPAVFLGRGADLILPREVGLRVFIVEPRELRVTEWAAQQGVDPAAAEQEVDRLQKERDEFIERHFRRRPDDLTRYDLVLNRTAFGTSEAVEVILAAKGQRLGPRSS